MTPSDFPGSNALHGSHLPAVYEDLFVVIHASSLDIFCSMDAHATLAPLLLPYVSSVRFFSPPRALEDDGEAWEEYKVGSFVRSMLDQKRIGIPLPPAGFAPGDPLVVEEWPLIQAFGIEGVGRSGFFTMNMQVVDVLGELHDAIATVDSGMVYHIERCTTHLLDSWGQAMSAVGGADPKARAEVPLSTMLSPLTALWEAGQLRLPLGAAPSPIALTPRIAVGSQTTKLARGLSQFSSEEVTALTHAAKESFVSSDAHGAASHVCLEGTDPTTGVYLARTYLLTHAAEVPGTAAVFAGVPDGDLYLMHDELEAFENARLQFEGNKLARNASIVQACYEAIVEVGKAIGMCWLVGDRLTVTEATIKAQSMLALAAEEISERFGYPLATIFPGPAASSVVLDMWTPSSAQQSSKLEFDISANYLCVRVAWSGYVDPDDGVNLGGVVFGQTYFFTPNPLRYEEDAYVISKAHIFSSWSVNLHEIRCEMKILQGLEALRDSREASKGKHGRPATTVGLDQNTTAVYIGPLLRDPVEVSLEAFEDSGDGSFARILPGSSEKGMSSVGTFYCYSHGFVFVPKSMGLPTLIPLRKSSVSQIIVKRLTNTSGRRIPMLQVDMIEKQLLGIRGHMRGNADKYRIRVSLDTCLSRPGFRREVLGAWAAACVDEGIMWDEEQNLHVSEISSEREKNLIVNSIDEYHASITSPCDVVSHMRRRGADKPEIHLVFGLPGTTVGDIAQRLVALSDLSSALHLIKPELGWSDTHSLSALPGLATEYNKTLLQALESRQTIIITSWTCESFSNAILQLSTMKEVQENKYCVSSCSAIVSPGCLWEDVSRTKLYPGVLGHLQQGLTDNIVFDTDFSGDEGLIRSFAEMRCPSSRIFLSCSTQIPFEPLQSSFGSFHVYMASTFPTVDKLQSSCGPVSLQTFIIRGTVVRTRLYDALDNIIQTSRNKIDCCPELEETRPDTILGYQLWFRTERVSRFLRDEYARISDVANGDRLRSIIETDDSTVLQIWGTEISVNIGCLAQVSGPQRPKLNSMLTILDLDAAQKDVIETNAVADKSIGELPEGWTFDGTNYRDEWGNASERHPNWHTYVERYIVEENKKRREMNAELEQAWKRVVPITIASIC